MKTKDRFCFQASRELAIVSTSVGRDAPAINRGVVELPSALGRKTANWFGAIRSSVGILFLALLLKASCFAASCPVAGCTQSVIWCDLGYYTWVQSGYWPGPNLWFYQNRPLDVCLGYASISPTFNNDTGPSVYICPVHGMVDGPNYHFAYITWTWQVHKYNGNVINGTGPIVFDATWTGSSYVDIQARGFYPYNIYQLMPSGEVGPAMTSLYGPQLFEFRLSFEVCGNCTCSSGGCQQLYLNSVDVRLSMGNRNFSQGQVGRLRVHEEKPSADLATPRLLKYEGFQDAENGVELIRDGDVLRQVRSPQMLADIVVINSRKYEIRFYANPGELKNGLYQPDPTTWTSTTTIENPDTDAVNRLKVTKSTSDRKREAVYAWHGAAGQWQLETGNGIKKETLKKETQGNTSIETREVRDKNNLVVKKTQLRYETISNQLRKVEEIEDPDGVRLCKTSIYSPENLLMQVNNSDGSWECIQYNEAKMKWRVYSSYLNQPVTTDYTLCRMTEYNYQPVSPLDDGSVRPGWPRTVVEYVKGKEVGRTYYIIALGEERKMQCQSPGAPWDASNNIVTVTKTFVSGPMVNEVKSIMNPGGSFELYDYSFSEDGQTRTKTVYIGLANADQTGIVKGTKTLTITGKAGERLLQQVIDVESGLELEREIHSQFDLLRRAHRVDYLDGTHETKTFNCCGLETVVDRNGQETSYVYDDLNRQIATVRNGIMDINTLDADGRILAQSRQGQDGSALTLWKTSYDLAGRPLSQTDARGARTTYDYGLDSMGQRALRTVNADGGQKLETYALDGRLLKVIGNSVKRVRYAWDVESDENISRVVSAVVKLDGNGNDTSEWVKTYQDMLGRSYKVVYADGAFERTFYNEKNQVWKQQDLDGVVTLSQYNDLGALEYTAVDVDRNDHIDLAGQDRVTRTTRAYVTSHGVTVQRTQTLAWPNDKKDLPVLVASQEQSLDGRSFWSTQNRLTTHYETVIDGNGNKTTTVTNPDQTRTITQFRNGHTIKAIQLDAKDKSLGQTTFEYDAHGRRTAVVDARNGKTSYQYDAGDKVVSVTTPAPSEGEAAQTTTMEYDALGRPTKITYADGGVVQKEYYPDGSLKAIYGTRTYPVEYNYDAQGRIQTMTTWTDYAKRQGATTTTWQYDVRRGWLSAKRYADGTGPEYDYSPSGKIKNRKWARGINTTYGYTPAGELSEVVYSDKTNPKIRYTYNRQGLRIGVTQILGANQAVGSQRQPETTVLASATEFNDLGQLVAERYTAGPLTGLTVANSYDTLGRRIAIEASHNARITLQSFSYDDASRLQAVTEGDETASYSYLANSPLVEQIEFKHAGLKQMTTTKQYDRLNRLKKIASTPSDSSVLSTAYDYNPANQRIKASLEKGSHWDYTYDSLGQMTSGIKLRANRTDSPDEDFEYTHDDIGNRTAAGGRKSALAHFSANELNQYTRIDDSQSQGKTETMQYDTDGNLIADGTWKYTWDAENRLVAMESASDVPPGQRQRLEFGYDPQSRRISKKVFDWESARSNFSLQPSVFSLFAYDGWNLLAELTTDLQPKASFVWGLDLSGGQQGAGGVGGLLLVSDNRAGAIDSHAVAYDGNGNVVALVDTRTGRLSAKYDHGPFGEQIKSTGGMAHSNPFRFSTKYTDDETDFVYYGFRYYNPLLGRWLSRDPISERGGLNTYAFVGNSSVNMVDYHGLTIVCKCLDSYLQANGISQSMYTRSGDTFWANWGVTFSSYGAAQILWNMLKTSHTFTARNYDIDNLKINIAKRWKIAQNAVSADFAFGTGYPLDQAALLANPQAYYNSLNGHGYLVACTALSRMIFETGNDFGRDNGGFWVEGQRPYDGNWSIGDWGWIQNMSWEAFTWPAGLEGENVINTGTDLFWGHFASGVQVPPSKSESEWFTEIYLWHNEFNAWGSPSWRNSIKYAVTGLQQ